MCGIFGYASLSPSASLSGAKELRHYLESMARSLHHRGPDDEGFFIKKNPPSHRPLEVGLGNCRLAILDPKQGQQPAISKNKKIALVQNGEIYNYKELLQELEKEGIPLKGIVTHGFYFVFMKNMA